MKLFCIPKSMVISLIIFRFAFTAATSTITQFGITWTFDKDSEYGQFANGDFWVIGPVDIVKIEPATTGDPVLHGSMLNPVISSRQGYDSRVTSGISYDSTLNVARGVSSAVPLTIPPGNSLVSCESKASTAVRPYLKTAAVLTVLAAAPPAGSFRPPFTDVDKTVRYNKSQLNFNRLQKLAPTASVPALSAVEPYFERPWTDHAGSNVGHQYMAAEENMPNYGREVSQRTSLAALMVNLDFTDAQKEKLVIGMVQTGIDLYGLIIQGGGIDRWEGGGGHNCGRKWPVLFAGLMLEDEGLIKVKAYFQEDDQTYYGACWTGAEVLWGPNHRTRANEAGGDYEHKHPSQWTVDGRGQPGDPAAGSNSDFRAESYRQCCNGHVWVGTALACRLMGAMDHWNHPPYFDYVDRWMNEDWAPFADTILQYCGQVQDYYQGGTSHPCITELWNAYRDYAPFVSISPRPGTYTGARLVTLESSSRGDTVYYTLDGSDPDRTGLVYTGPLLLTATTTVKAQAFKGSLAPSPIASASFTIEPDTILPEVKTAYAQAGSSSVTVVYSEMVDRTSAETAGNYGIDNGISVTQAVLQTDLKTVVLTTSALAADTVYTLSVSNVKDLAVPANTMAAADINIDLLPVYFDDFESGGLLTWAPKTASRWSIRLDMGDHCFYLNTTSFSSDGDKPGEYTLLDEGGFTNFKMEFEGRTGEASTNNGADFGFIFGFVDYNNFYYFECNRYSGSNSLYRFVNGTRYQMIGFPAPPCVPDTVYHTYAVQCLNNEATFWYDGEIKLQIYLPVQHGQVGLCSYNDAGFFDNFKLTPLAGYETAIKEPSTLPGSPPAFRSGPGPYPQPAGGGQAFITINASTAGPIFLSLYSVSGELVCSLPACRLSAGPNRVRLPLEGLDNGLYILRDARGVVCRKLMVTR